MLYHHYSTDTIQHEITFNTEFSWKGNVVIMDFQMSIVFSKCIVTMGAQNENRINNISLHGTLH